MLDANNTQFVLNKEKLFHEATRASNEETPQLNDMIDDNIIFNGMVLNHGYDFSLYFRRRGSKCVSK